MNDSTSDRAAEAREGLVDTIAGKAKEVAGAVTGRDDLAEEGQLQQAEARKRKDALADEAIADAQREEAAQELREAGREAAREQGAARAQAEREEALAERERASEHAAASADAARLEAAGQDSAERRADAIAEDRLDRAGALESEADRADQEAAQLRAETQN